MSEMRNKILGMLMESQFWPPETMLAFQRSQLAQLLRHARENVPFYKTRLDPVFKKNDDIDWDRWHELPIVTRADLRDRRNELLAAKLPPGHGPSQAFSTSGSSGIPVAMEITWFWGRANRAAIHRFHMLHGIDPAKSSASFSTSDKSPELLASEYLSKPKESRSPSVVIAARRLVLNRSLAESRKLDILEAEGVDYIFDIPTNVEVLAIANLSRKNPVRLEALVFHGQGVTLEQRNLFQKSFGARSLAIYSSEEGGLMGYQCAGNHHYHLNHEMVFLEILTSEGLACGPGEPGRVVVTPFFSTALPLVRYEQGDTAEFLPSCTCGSKLPLIGNISGRQDQFMRFPEGVRTATGLSQSLLRENLNALAFQLAQVETYKLELRFVPADKDRPVNPVPIVAHLRELIHPKLDIIFKPVENVPLNAGGKHQRFVCELPHETVGRRNG
jgi:phenylacetate-CoA ligase